MNNIDLIVNSYNLKIQNKIFNELDKIEEAKALYFESCNKTKFEFKKKIQSEKIKVTESKVYLKYLKGEINLELKNKKRQYKQSALQFKENYKLEKLEIRDSKRLYIQKLTSIIKKELANFDNQISLDSLNLDIDEAFVKEVPLYQEALKNLTDKYHRTLLKVTKEYYIREKRLYYKYAIMNASNKEKIRLERNEFLKNYNDHVKHDENADLASFQKELILSDSYKYHLNDLKLNYYKNKQKLINNSYKEYQENLLKEKLEKITNKADIQRITEEHLKGDILYQRKQSHKQAALLLEEKKAAFRLNAETLLKEETIKINIEKENELRKAKDNYHQALNEKKEELSQFKLAWENKYFNKVEVERLKEEYKVAPSKALKEKIKEQNFIYREKKKHQKTITIHQENIAKLKLEMKAAVLKESENNLKYLEDKTKTIRSAKTNVKALKEKKKAYYKELSAIEKKAYNKMEKYARQERIERVRSNFDKLEKKAFRKINPAYIYVIPAYLSVLIFTLFPFVFMTVGSFFKIDLTNLAQSQFLGFTNYYNSFVKDREFQMALYNTLIYSLMTVGLLTVVTIGMAAWLHRDTKIHNATQTMVFTPHIASFVAVSILWIAMLRPDGLINQFLALFGIKGPGWLIQPNTALFSISLVTVWKDIGYYILIIISGLQSIPAYVYEAAQLDKASKKTQFFKLTLPLLTPTLSFVFITKFINSFKVFAPIEIMTNGGPMGSSMVLSYWIYKMGRVGYNYGTAMAGAVVLTIIIATFTIVNNHFSKRTIRYY